MAVSREQLIFDVLANTSKAGSDLTQFGRKVGAASDDVSALAKRLDDLSAKSAKARVELEGDKDAQAKLDKLDLKLVTLGNKTARPDVTVEGAARAAVEIGALDVELDHLSEKAGKAEGGVGSLAGIAGNIGAGGLGALIGVGVVLSPIIATLGVGLGGLGLAALAAGKHSKEFAAELAPLKNDFAAFSKELQPIVLQDFAKAAGVARDVLHGVEPVAAATGKALGGMLGAIDAEFKSGEWQGFFQFMASTAGPDIRLLTDNFVGLLQVLPPLLESLQPLAVTLLKDTAGLLHLVDAVENAVRAEHNLAQEASSNTGWFGRLAHAAGDAFKELVPGGVGIKHVADEFGRLSDNSSASSKGIQQAAMTAAKAGPPFFDLNKAVAKLNTSMTALIGNLLTLQGDNVAWQQSMQAAKKQLDSNAAGLEGNSKNALANKQAVISSSQAALKFASDQLTLHKNLGQASDTIQAQIRFLQGLHDKSQLVRDELAALRREEKLLNEQRINQFINVHGLGQWSVSQGLGPGGAKQGRPMAAGGRVPGYGGGDRFPALLEAGEAVVPKHLTPAVAPFLRAQGVPGFAAGLVPSYTGSPGGMPGWIKGNDAATIRLIDEAVVRATVAGMRAAQAAATAGAGPASHASLPYLEHLWDAAGGPPALAHLMAAIAMAESGGNPAARNPSGASGLWQILGLPFPGNPFDPLTNARMAVSKYESQGLGAWVTYTSGAYRQFYDNGGWLHPGATLAVNNTGKPERVLPPGQGGGPLVNVQTMVVQDATDAALVAQRLSFSMVAAGLS